AELLLRLSQQLGPGHQIDRGPGHRPGADRQHRHGVVAACGLAESGRVAPDARLADLQVRVDRRDGLADVADDARADAMVGGWDLPALPLCLEVLAEEPAHRLAADALLVADADLDLLPRAGRERGSPADVEE